MLQNEERRNTWDEKKNAVSEVGTHMQAMEEDRHA